MLDIKFVSFTMEFLDLNIEQVYYRAVGNHRIRADDAQLDERMSLERTT